MAKKPDLKPGEYGIKVEYWTTKKTFVWVNEVFTSIEQAYEYLDEYDPSAENENCAGATIVDWEGKDCGGYGY